MSGQASDPASGWRRTSRLGYLVRAIMALRNLLFPAAAALFGTGALRGGSLWVFPAIAAMVLISAFISWVAWRHFRYRVGDSDIRVERGLLNRTARSVPYERIHDVSLEQALVPRLFGMVEVKFETGAGGKDEIKIGYITEAEGAALRETVRARKDGTGIAVADSAEAALAPGPSRVLYRMGPRRLLTFGLFEFSLIVFALVTTGVLVLREAWRGPSEARILAAGGLVMVVVASEVSPLAVSEASSVAPVTESECALEMVGCVRSSSSRCSILPTLAAEE